MTGKGRIPHHNNYPVPDAVNIAVKAKEILLFIILSNATSVNTPLVEAAIPSIRQDAHLLKVPVVNQYAVG